MASWTMRKSGAQAREVRPRLIIAGASAYPRTIDFAAFGEIAREVGAYLMVDMAHIAGLVAAGLHPSPVPHAEFVTSTTHKTMRGPRGGFILCQERFGPAIDKAVFPGIQGGPLMHVIAAKAVCFKEAQSEGFRRYQEQVVANARTLAKALSGYGFNLVSGGTDNHLMLIDLRNKNITGQRAEALLEEVGMTVNKNYRPPGDPGPESYQRDPHRDPGGDQPRPAGAGDGDCRPGDPLRPVLSGGHREAGGGPAGGASVLQGISAVCAGVMTSLNRESYCSTYC